MAGIGTQGPGISGALGLTWVTDHLAHVIGSSEADEYIGTWTGLPSPHIHYIVIPALTSPARG